MKVTAVHEPPAYYDLPASLEPGAEIVARSASEGSSLVVFPETWLPGYVNFVWSLTPTHDETGDYADLYKRLWANAVDLEKDALSPIRDAARENGVVVVLGVEEKAGGTLYNTGVIIDADGTILNVHRKLMPTNAERTVWGFGDGSTLRVVETAVARTAPRHRAARSGAAGRALRQAPGDRLMATRTISQRIALTGSEEIRKQLAALGEWGEKAFRDVQAAAEKLKGPGAEFARNMDRARKRVSDLGQAFDKVGSKIRNFGAGVSLGITAPLVLAAKQSVAAWNEQVDAIQKVEAALASTKGASGQTSAGLQKMASELQGITTFGDEAVLSMQAVLLTFTNVRGQRFEKATKAILNVATALGQDLQSAALQVGKALNDPRRGITALSRAGIQFSDVQKANIKQMVEMGDVAGAQGIILKELETQFGGIAEAMAKTPTGQWTVAMNALGDGMEQVGQIIVPYITRLAAVIKEAALAFQALPEGARTTIVLLAGVGRTLREDVRALLRAWIARRWD